MAIASANVYELSAWEIFRSMERLSRFAIYLGIGIGLTFFVLFLVAALPGTIIPDVPSST